MKKRVMCANCGMVYDIDMSLLWQQCPSCKSNAYDAIEKKPNYREHETWIFRYWFL